MMKLFVVLCLCVGILFVGWYIFRWGGFMITHTIHHQELDVSVSDFITRTSP